MHNTLILTSTFKEEAEVTWKVKLSEYLNANGLKPMLMKNGLIRFVLPMSSKISYPPSGYVNLKNVKLVVNLMEVSAGDLTNYYMLLASIDRNIKVLPTPQQVLLTKDKLATLIKLQNIVKIPKTVVIRQLEDLKWAYKQLTRNFKKVVIKEALGSGGKRVLLASTYSQLKGIFEYIWFYDRNRVLLIQEWIPSLTRGYHSDVRILMWKDKFIHAMMRYSRNYKTNVKAGAKAKPVLLTPEELKLVKMVARKLNLSLAGYDIIRSASGPVFIEINSVPTLNMVQKTGEMIGKNVIKEVANWFTINFYKK